MEPIVAKLNMFKFVNLVKSIHIDLFKTGELQAPHTPISSRREKNKDNNNDTNTFGLAVADEASHLSTIEVDDKIKQYTLKFDFDNFLSDVDKRNFNSKELLEALKEYDPRVNTIISAKISQSIRKVKVLGALDKMEEKEIKTRLAQKIEEFVVKNIVKRQILDLFSFQLSKSINNSIAQELHKHIPNKLQKRVKDKLNKLNLSIDSFANMFQEDVKLASKNSSAFLKSINNLKKRKSEYVNICNTIMGQYDALETNIKEVFDKIKSSNNSENFTLGYYQNYIKYKYNVDFSVLRIAMRQMIENFQNYLNNIDKIEREYILNKSRQEILLNVKILKKQFKNMDGFIDTIDSVNLKEFSFIQNDSTKFKIKKISNFLNRIAVLKSEQNIVQNQNNHDYSL